MVDQAPFDVEYEVAPYRRSDTTSSSGVVSALEAAQTLGVNERTIRRAIERGELAAVKHGRAFQITPEALDRFQARRRSAGREPTPPASTVVELRPPGLKALPKGLPPRPDILPAALTRFIGREREVAAVADLLRQHDVRLVALTGPGGVGKTRLALRVAEAIGEDFADGVAFVPLASVRGPDLVLPAIARVLGVREPADRPLAANLAAALRDRVLLLVLDNFEHLVGAANELADLLASCPRLTILVTSRASLRLSGEHRFPTPPLALPDAGETPALDRLPAFEAIALFLERARQVRPGFALDAGNAASVLEICRRLDGLPLAIELAAAWLRVLSPAALLTRLERRLPLLTDGAPDQPVRLRTMRDAVAWSHDLLADDEQRLFRRLAVFVGGFTLDAADAVAGRGAEEPRSREEDGKAASRSTLDLLAGLTDKSLLQVEQPAAGEPRLMMLETVREFALERLDASGAEAATREAHAAHYLTLAEAAASDAGGASDGGWMRRLTAERPNLRAALDWFEQTGQAGAVLRMSGALWHYWYRLGDLAEGRARLERALAAAPQEIDPALRARALRGAGVLAWQSADYEQSRERLEAALTAYRELGDQTGIAWALNSLGCLCATLSDVEQAEASLSEALAIFRELDDAVGIANLTSNLGELAAAQDQHELAVARLGSGLAMWRDLGDRVGAVRAQVYLGRALLARGEAARAEAVLLDALAAIRDIDYKQILPAALRAVAQLATRRGDDVAAARWYGAADGVMEALGMELPAVRRGGHDRAVTTLRERLGEAAFAAAWAEGRADPAGVIAALVDRDDAAIAAVRTDDGLGGTTRLTAREREVLLLLAQGRSDREIADALFVTRRTASKHVSAILAKLGVSSRATAAAISHRDHLV